MTFSDPAFWIALAQIIGVNIVLSGDNAVVIALAARSLPPKQQKQAVLWGSGAAVVMRIVLTIVAVELLRLPFLKLIGAALLLWIGIQLLIPEGDEGGGHGTTNTGMISAVRTILIADLVMSLDNVIAVAAAAKGDLTLLIVGLLISIPLVIFGSTLLMKFMERWPVIITIGGALLGWVSGEMAISDPLVKDWVDANAAWLHYAAPVAGALFVVAFGKWLALRAEQRSHARPVVDLAEGSDQASGAADARPRRRVLVAADDSPASLAGVARFIERARSMVEPVAVDLISVQAPVHRDVAAFVENDAVKGMHHDDGLKALGGARAQLEAAGIPHVVHIAVGETGHVLAQYAQDLKATEIYITETARTDGSGLDAAIEHARGHTGIPVTVLR